ncbi:hypothetical protein KSF_084420 [Reticulibacter mediterranei]|uniref:Uncharacterized protein n=1 Tax=Reticulibacter mediterranei TaxID=2778369 RepID=A0A8J3N4T8_9CHLR|nr:hypothetical protein [Reticulibacter mediterranei]GHO98394.1 hypothetical protein KSF_084420 [Reticulibacter mediterranei]
MSSTIGVDCEVILDSVGYWIRPNSYTVRQPRIRQATIRADGSEGYVDLGPGKREWSMTILCINDLMTYSGVSTGISGQQYRDMLHASYINSIGSTINFTDPTNNTFSVHLDSFAEHIPDLHGQITALATGGSLACSYEVTIALVEA